MLCKAKRGSPTLCSRMTTSYKYKSGFGAVNRMPAVVGKTRGDVEGKPCWGHAILFVALCEGRRGGQFAVPATASRSNLRLVFSAVSTPAGPSSAHFVATCKSGCKMRAFRWNRGSFRMSSRQFQLSRYEEKGKALEVARTAGSADAFPVHRERHHEGMEVRNRETKRDTLRRLKRKRGTYNSTRGNTTQIHKCKDLQPAGSAASRVAS